MKIIVGLGNPGVEYEGTRHNVGFVVLDRLARAHAAGEIARSRFHSLCIDARLPHPEGGPESRCLLLKPTTYMNRSGQAVGEAVRFYKLDPERDVLVVVDEVALECGRFRIRARGSAGGHNGLADIERHLGTDRYARLRIGVDPPGQIPQRDYVLGKFAPDQLVAVEEQLPTIEAACRLWAAESVDAAMNRYNVKLKTRQKQQKAEEPAAGDETSKPNDAAREDAA
jgi:peptidyl-tRNA hydrolase, PTH1 family